MDKQQLTRRQAAVRQHVESKGRRMRMFSWMWLTCNVLAAPLAAQVRNDGNSPASATGAAAISASAADSAACARVTSYFVQHPDMLQKGEQVDAGDKVKEILTFSDTVRASIADGIVKGQISYLKALARQTLDPPTVDTFDEVIAYIAAFPIPVRVDVARLITSRKAASCGCM